MINSPVQNDRKTIPQTFHDACRQLLNGRVEAVAEELGKAASTVYKYGQNPNASGKIMPGNLIVPISLFLENHSLIEWMANRLGLIAYQIPDSDSDHNLNRLAMLTKEFGESLQVASEALEDGRITRAEFQRIEKEFYDLMTTAKATLEAFRFQVQE